MTMNANQIYNEILMQSDEELLKSLPTKQREVCKDCCSIDIRQRKDKTWYCSQCKKAVETTSIIWYYKNKTSDPIEAIARHRIFWNKIYYIELAKENIIEPIK